MKVQSRVVLLIFVIFFSINTYAQRSRKEITAILTDRSYRTWNLEGTEIILSDADTCTSGTQYYFEYPDKLTIKDCINKRWERKTHSWQLKKLSSFDWDINYDNKSYRLVIKEHERYYELILRTVSDEIITGTEGLKFYSIK